MMIKYPRLPLLGLLLACTLATAPRLSLAQPETFSGKVVAVTDGDTVGVLRDGREVKIRLHGIDAPESIPAFGDAAKRFTSERVFGESVTVRVIDTDRYGRLVGVVTAGQGESLNEALVQSGFAWWYHQSGAKERKLAEAEIDVRAARRRLWKDPHPTPPWDYRHPGEVADSGEGSRPAAPAPSSKQADSGVGNAAAAPVLRPAVAQRTADTQAAVVYITRTGSKYHRAGCRFLKSGNTVSVDEAKVKGLTPCSVCRP